jgi:hypothetical protein
MCRTTCKNLAVSSHEIWYLIGPSWSNLLDMKHHTSGMSHKRMYMHHIHCWNPIHFHVKIGASLYRLL